MTANPHTTDVVPTQVERDYRWNFAVNAMDGAFFWFGATFISVVVILPLYISHFTDNPVLIGLVHVSLYLQRRLYGGVESTGRLERSDPRGG